MERSCNRVFSSLLGPRRPLEPCDSLDIRQRHPVTLTVKGAKALQREEARKCLLSRKEVNHAA